MRNVTRVLGDSDETRVGIFGPDSTALAFFVMWRPFLWLFGRIENFSTRPIALASFVARRKKRGLSGHIEKFSTRRILLASFVARRKKRGVSVHFEKFRAHCEKLFIAADSRNLHFESWSLKVEIWSLKVRSCCEYLKMSHSRNIDANSTRCNHKLHLFQNFGAGASHQTQSDVDAMLMRCWCDVDAMLMRCYVMKNIILRVYQKLKRHKNTCFRRKIARSLRKKHRFGLKTSFWGCIKS